MVKEIKTNNIFLGQHKQNTYIRMHHVTENLPKHEHIHLANSIYENTLITNKQRIMKIQSRNLNKSANVFHLSSTHI